MVLRGDGIGLEELENHLRALKTTAKALNDQGIKVVLKHIMPEYTPDLEAKPVIAARSNEAHELRNCDTALPESNTVQP